MYRFLKTFLFVSVPIFSYLAVHFIVMNNRDPISSIVVAVFIGSIIGALVAAYIVLTLATSSVGVKDHVTNWSYILEVKADREEVANLCRSAVQSLGRKVKFLTSVGTDLEIKAQIGQSFGSWGELVTLTLTTPAQTICRIGINSKSRFRWTLRDNGVNRTNCFAIARFIENQVGPEQVIRSHLDEKNIGPQ